MLNINFKLNFFSDKESYLFKLLLRDCILSSNNEMFNQSKKFDIKIFK